MKKLLLTAVSITLLLACNNNAKESAKEAVKEVAPIAKNSAWAMGHLTGKVKTIEESHYTPNSEGNISVMDSCCTEVDVHNEKGFVVISYERDSKGMVTEETIIISLDRRLYLLPCIFIPGSVPSRLSSLLKRLSLSSRNTGTRLVSSIA